MPSWPVGQPHHGAFWTPLSPNTPWITRSILIEIRAFKHYQCNTIAGRGSLSLQLARVLDLTKALSKSVPAHQKHCCGIESDRSRRCPSDPNWPPCLRCYAFTIVMMLPPSRSVGYFLRIFVAAACCYGIWCSLALARADYLFKKDTEASVRSAIRLVP